MLFNVIHYTKLKERLPILKKMASEGGVSLNIIEKYDAESIPKDLIDKIAKLLKINPIKRKKDEARIQSLVALKEHGRVIWRTTNQGYLRGQHVRYGGVNYVATVDVEPKDTFDHTQWHLVK